MMLADKDGNHDFAKTGALPSGVPPSGHETSRNSGLLPAGEANKQADQLNLCKHCIGSEEMDRRDLLLQAQGLLPSRSHSESPLEDVASRSTFRAKVAHQLSKFFDSELGKMRGSTIGGTLRQEYIFCTAACALLSTFWYPTILALSSGDWYHGIIGLTGAMTGAVMLPYLYASYRRDTGRMTTESFWARLVPQETLKLMGIKSAKEMKTAAHNEDKSPS